MTSPAFDNGQGRVPVEMQDLIFSLVAATSFGDIPAIALLNKFTSSRVTPLLYNHVRIENLRTLKLFLSLPRPLVQTLQIGDCPLSPIVPSKKGTRKPDYTNQEDLLGHVPEMCPNVQKLSLYFVPEDDNDLIKELCTRMKNLRYLSLFEAGLFAQAAAAAVELEAEEEADEEEEPDEDENDEEEDDDRNEEPEEVDEDAEDPAEDVVEDEVEASGEDTSAHEKDATEPTKSGLGFHSLTHAYFGGIPPWDGVSIPVPQSLFPSLTHVAFFVDGYGEDSPPSMITDVIQEWITLAPTLQKLVLSFDKDASPVSVLNAWIAWHQHICSRAPSHPARCDRRIVCVKTSESSVDSNHDQFEFMDRLWALADGL
ncbi:hypothetical protein DL96DRAFT_1813007 [Flagelloscypha sp. PMI_526]|nr:hypothetical protein DL96DRAFT_1813007 [Flagelloscypha sp. PMI_526]